MRRRAASEVGRDCLGASTPAWLGGRLRQRYAPDLRSSQAASSIAGRGRRDARERGRGDGLNTGSGATGTREKILEAALRLFAKHGIDAVSLRTINAAAGARNASAVHYHFGNKQGVVLAVLERIRAQLDLERSRVLDALERSAHPDVRTLLDGWLDAYLALERDAAMGRDAFTFLGRLVADPGERIQRALTDDPQQTMHRFDALLARALPQLTAPLRRSRYLYVWSLVVQMLATAETWELTPVGDLRRADDNSAKERLLDFLCGGLTAPVSGPDQAAEPQ
jgi:AcrR family transcriptional regulator